MTRRRVFVLGLVRLALALVLGAALALAGAAVFGAGPVWLPVIGLPVLLVAATTPV